jgi:glycine cleavage system H protein
MSLAPAILESFAWASPITRKASWVLDAHQAFGEIEAVKAVSELYSPLPGEVTEINNALDQDASVVNRDPYGNGWMISLKVAGPDELKGLMSPSEYRSHIGE